MADSEKRVQVKYILDSTGFNSSLQGINSELKLNQAELKNAQVGLTVFGESSDKLKGVQQALSTQFETQSKKVDIYRQSLEQAQIKMETNVAERDKIKNALDMEKAKLEGATSAYGKNSEVAQNCKEKVIALTEQYNQQQKAVENNAKSIVNSTTNMTKAETELQKLQGELNKSNQKLAESQSGWINSGKSLETASKSFKTLGEGANQVGDTLLKFSAPIVVGLGAATKSASDFEHQLADIRKEVEATGIPTAQVNSLMAQMSQSSLKWSEDFGQSTDGINEGLLTLVKDGYSASEAMNIMQTSLYTARGSDEELSTTVDKLGSSLEAYGMKTSDATTTTENMSHMADTFAYIANHTKASISSLGEAFSTVGPTASTLKQPMSEVAAAIGILQSNGIEASTAAASLQAGLVNLTKPTKKMQTAMQEMNFTAFDSKGNMKDLTTILNEMESKTKGWTNEQKEAAIATIFGKESLASWSKLLDKGGDYLGTLSTNANNATGEVQRLSDSMKNTPKNQLKELEESVHALGVEFGEDVLPALMPVVKEATELVKEFANLDDGTKKTIISVAGFAAAGGIGLKVIGGLAGSIGNILGLVGKFSTAVGTAKVAVEGVSVVAGAAETATAGVGVAAVEATAGAGGLAVGFETLALAAAPWVVAGAAVAGTGYLIYKGMNEEAIPSVNLFADQVQYTSQTIQTEYGAMTQNVATGTVKISDSTKQAVKSYLDMDQGAKTYLQDLYINNQTITDKVVTESKTKFDDMKNTIVQGYEKQKTDSITKLQELFTKQNDLTTQEQADVLQKTTTFYTNQQTQTQQYEDKINQIIQTASNENRTLTSQEVTDIGQLQNQMRDNAVKSLSDQEVESQVILQRMKDYDGRITAEQAAEHIQKLNESRDGAVQAANDEYDKNIATITKMRDETGALTSEQADKMIEDAKRQRDETVQAAEDTRSQAIEKIKDMDSNLESEVDTSTGKILTWWDKLSSWWSSWSPSQKTFDITGNASNLDTSNADQLTINSKWTGDSNYQGGYTTLHEKGYELYDLPSGTKIYNHDSSEDLVLKTAESVATKVANNIAQNSAGSSNSQPMVLQIPVVVDGREIARASATYVGNDLAFNTNRKGW